MGKFERVIWIVLDSVGIGELPDAAEYGDAGRNTLGHIAESRPLQIPTLAGLGLGNIAPLQHVSHGGGSAWVLWERGNRFSGKRYDYGTLGDGGSVAGSGISRLQEGFPPEVLEAFEKQIGRKTLGNKPASGTEIIKELGEEHVRTGKPIVYTSGDSVFQIAAHEEVIPIAELYQMMRSCAKIVGRKASSVGRVIARPFMGAPGNFTRTSRRHDYAVDPPWPMLLDVLQERRVPVYGVGKIHDIYNGRGVNEYVTTKSNADGMEKLTLALGERPERTHLLQSGRF